MIAFLKRLFSKHSDEFNQAPDWVCPNCWGDQEYDNVIREKYKDLQIEVNNHSSKHAFIQDFVVTNLRGIQLKSKVNLLECPTCRVIYKDEDQ